MSIRNMRESHIRSTTRWSLLPKKCPNDWDTRKTSSRICLLTIPMEMWLPISNSSQKTHQISTLQQWQQITQFLQKALKYKKKLTSKLILLPQHSKERIFDSLKIITHPPLLILLTTNIILLQLPTITSHKVILLYNLFFYNNIIP